jgi:hypothetical protein
LYWIVGVILMTSLDWMFTAVVSSKFAMKYTDPVDSEFASQNPLIVFHAAVAVGNVTCDAVVLRPAVAAAWAPHDALEIVCRA